MKLKKINAVLTWFTSMCFLTHLYTMSVFMLTGWFNVGICMAGARATAMFVSLHTVISLIILFFSHDGSSLTRYAKLNKETVMQRATAISMMILVHFHLKAFGFITAGTALSIGQKIFIIVTEVLFFASCNAHLGISFPRSLITMGIIREDSAELKAARITRLVTVLSDVFCIISLIIFIVRWNGFAG